MREKRGQAALEYLTTYGWVLLTVFVAIGALAYFGFLDPSKFIPNRCGFGAQLVCEDFVLQSDGALNFKVRNNFGKTIEIVDVSGVDARYPVECSGTGLPVEVGIGNIQEIRCTVTDSNVIFSGDKYSIPVKITFQRNDTGDPPRHNITGEVFTEAQ